MPELLRNKKIGERLSRGSLSDEYEKRPEALKDADFRPLSVR